MEFWHWWARSERPFFAADRPWERARFIVSGQALPGLADDEIAWAEGRWPGPEPMAPREAPPIRSRSPPRQSPSDPSAPVPVHENAGIRGQDEDGIAID